jgi:poly(A) polymerase
MEEQPKRQWGVTQAISHAPPKDEELKLNDKLVAALTAENNFETPEQTKARCVSAHMPSHGHG